MLVWVPAVGGRGLACGCCSGCRGHAFRVGVQLCKLLLHLLVCKHEGLLGQLLLCVRVLLLVVLTAHACTT